MADFFRKFANRYRKYHLRKLLPTEASTDENTTYENTTYENTTYENTRFLSHEMFSLLSDETVA